MRRRCLLPACPPRGCRGFLPGLTGLLKTTEQRQRREQWQRVVQHPQETIYKVVADVGAYHEFLPWCLSSRVLEQTTAPASSETTPASSELSTEISVGFELMRSSFFSQVTLTPNETVHAVSAPNDYLEHLTFTWSFAPVGDNATRLDLELDFCLRNAEHILLWDFAQDKIISEYVSCFSRRCSALQVRGAAPPPKS